MHCMNTNIKVEDVVNGIGWPKREREIYRGLFTALSVNKVWNQGGLWLKTTNRLIFAHWIQLSNARLTHWPYPKDITYLIFKAELHVIWWPIRSSMLSLVSGLKPLKEEKHLISEKVWSMPALMHSYIIYLDLQVKSSKGGHGGK